MNNFICPICKNTIFKTIGKPTINVVASKIIKEEYSIVQCSVCTSYSVFPQINFTSEEWKQLYASDYFAGQNAWLINRRRHELEERINRLERYAEIRIKKFLDIGCGEGNTFEHASKKGWEVWAVDVVDNRKEEAKDSTFHFSIGTLLDMDYPDNSFDCIYIDSVLEHVINPIDYLKEINRVLRKGGVGYIGVPNEDSFFNDIKKTLFSVMGKKEISSQLKPFDNPYHIIGFNKNSLEYAVAKTGSKIVNFRNFGRKFEFLAFSPKTRDFWISLFLVPVEFIGYVINRDVYFDAIITKE